MNVIVRRLLFLASTLACASSLVAQTSPSAQTGPSPASGAVEFYLTGDEYNGVVTIKEVTGANKSTLGAIGGMRLHSLRVPVSLGEHSYLVTMGDDANGRLVQVNVQSGTLRKVQIDLHAVKSESSGLRSITTYYEVQTKVEAPQVLPPETKFSDLPQSQQTLFIVAAVVAVPLVWFLPIWLGIRAARRKGVSPHWMWFGVHPLGAWLAFLIIGFGVRPRRNF